MDWSVWVYWCSMQLCQLGRSGVKSHNPKKWKSGGIMTWSNWHLRHVTATLIHLLIWHWWKHVKGGCERRSYALRGRTVLSVLRQMQYDAADDCNIELGHWCLYLQNVLSWLDPNVRVEIFGRTFQIELGLVGFGLELYAGLSDTEVEHRAFGQKCRPNLCAVLLCCHCWLADRNNVWCVNSVLHNLKGHPVYNYGKYITNRTNLL